MSTNSRSLHGVSSVWSKFRVALFLILLLVVINTVLYPLLTIAKYCDLKVHQYMSVPGLRDPESAREYAKGVKKSCLSEKFSDFSISGSY